MKLGESIRNTKKPSRVFFFNAHHRIDLLCGNEICRP